MYLYIVVSNIVVKYSRNNNIMTKQNSKKPWNSRSGFIVCWLCVCMCVWVIKIICVTKL
jgi:hypothetical protein